jgi:hypothetical protein
MEVIRSAREMLDLLRGLVDSYQGAVITTNRGADLEDISAAEEAFSRAGLLVARIDAAKAGT